MNTESVPTLPSETPEELLPVVHSRRASGVEMFIAVNSLLRGPALGGCRWQLYSDREVAQREAMDLASAMTRKAALADLRLGGGKAVVIGDPAQRSRDQLRAFGDFVESLGGTYITAEDMGTAPEDMAVIRERTGHVIGLPPDQGGCGDPSPHTAEGVFLAIQAALGYLGRRVEAARVAVQGVGAVGQDLVRRLLRAGASVAATDVDPEKLRALPEEVERVEVAEIRRLRCDVFAPCGPPGCPPSDGRVRTPLPPGLRRREQSALRPRSSGGAGQSTDPLRSRFPRQRRRSHPPGHSAGRRYRRRHPTPPRRHPAQLRDGDGTRGEGRLESTRGCRAPGGGTPLAPPLHARDLTWARDFTSPSGFRDS